MITPSQLDLKISTWYVTTKQKTLRSLADYLGVTIKQLYTWRNKVGYQSIIDNTLENMIPKQSIDNPWFGKGKTPLFDTAAQVWQSAIEYIEWNKQNPLLEHKVISAGGEVVHVEVPKMRAMTIDGLCIYLGIHRDTWYDMARREHLAATCKQVGMIIRDQKFSGAAGGLLNPMIVARDLGLVDAVKNQMVGGDPGDSPVRQEIKVTMVRPGDIVKDD